MLKLDNNKITRNLGVGRQYKLVPMLERAISTFDDEWQFTYQEKVMDHHWHPSGHCLPAPSELYEIATGQFEERPISPGLRKAFQVGHFWHQWLQYICLNKLEVCDAESIERLGMTGWGPGGPYHAVAGSGDIAPCITKRWRGIVDYKTMHPEIYAKKEIPEGKFRFAAKYECQMNIYFDLFEEDEGIIVAIDKANGDMKEYLYRRNQDLIDAIYAKWKFVSECLDEGIEINPAEDDKWPELPLTGPIG